MNQMIKAMDNDFEDGYFPEFTEENFPKITWHIDERLINPPKTYDKKAKLYPSFRTFVGAKIRPYFTLYKVNGHKLSLKNKLIVEASFTLK